MADVSHELGSLRHIVDSPLSSKVAMFNKQATQHKENQLLNPFSGESGRRSPKPSFNKDEYGKPLAGSLTEARGQKANIHVLREMKELCQIINSEGYAVKDEPSMRVIPFGELFNIYNYISDKVVGICLRARKHKLIEFEGEMLFQRRDDDVPIFLLKPISEIQKILDEKTEDIKRGVSPAPQATSILLDKRSRSASPNVGKREPIKESTAKVPEIQESTKENENNISLAPIKEPLVVTPKIEEENKIESVPVGEDPVVATEIKELTKELKKQTENVEAPAPTTDVAIDAVAAVPEPITEPISQKELSVEKSEELPAEARIEKVPEVEQPKSEPPPIIITEDKEESCIDEIAQVSSFIPEATCDLQNENKNEQEEHEGITSLVSSLQSITEVTEGIAAVDENNNSNKNDDSLPV